MTERFGFRTLFTSDYGVHEVEVTDCRVQHVQFNWYGHVRRINEESLPPKIVELCLVPAWKKKKGKTFVDAEITIGMRQK